MLHDIAAEEQVEEGGRCGNGKDITIVAMNCKRLFHGLNYFEILVRRRLRECVCCLEAEDSPSLYERGARAMSSRRPERQRMATTERNRAIGLAYGYWSGT